ncbi:MAG: DNA-directed RNA polymerase [Ignisphaera sp.]|uniref:DNA-directed RNA polymerase subunit Rpo7 n=1 Tax=Ignisphaera aggregans TaxID=334771 RepID=A0A7C4GYZ4_9CREN
MFRIYRLSDIIRIDPSKFGKPLEEIAFEELRKKYEGLKDKNLGLVLAIINIKVDPEGFIPLGDGAPHHRVEFDVLTYVPIINEIVEGPVNIVGRMGITLKIGPLEGFVHISQIADEEVKYDPLRNSIVLTQSKKIITQGDIVRARVTSISFGPQAKLPRISMTMRQPYLGKLEWIEEKIRKSSLRDEPRKV